MLKSGPIGVQSSVACTGPGCSTVMYTLFAVFEGSAESSDAVNTCVWFGAAGTTPASTSTLVEPGAKVRRSVLPVAGSGSLSAAGSPAIPRGDNASPDPTSNCTAYEPDGAVNENAPLASLTV